jgi:hypothetical protein
MFTDALASMRVGALLLRAHELDRLIRIASDEESAELMRERAELQRQLGSLEAGAARLGYKASLLWSRRRDPGSAGPTTPER